MSGQKIRATRRPNQGGSAPNLPAVHHWPTALPEMWIVIHARPGVQPGGHPAGVACALADMIRRPTTVEIDEGILDSLGRTVREGGRPEDEVVEEALRDYFGLRGMGVLDEIADAQAAAGVALDGDEAMELAVAEFRAARAERARRATA